MSEDVNLKRYLAAAHAMQSGIADEMQTLPGPTEPKLLRFGINNCLVSDDALVKLLIAKGIITQEEYLAILAETMEDEVRQYEERASERAGVPIKFA